jgi:hypothetical protein
MSRDKFKTGDRVVAGIHPGWVVGPCEYDADRILVTLDIGEMRSYHWAECGKCVEPPEAK